MLKKIHFIFALFLIFISVSCTNLFNSNQTKITIQLPGGTSRTAGDPSTYYYKITCTNVNNPSLKYTKSGKAGDVVEFDTVNVGDYLIVGECFYESEMILPIYRAKETAKAEAGRQTDVPLSLRKIDYKFEMANPDEEHVYLSDFFDDIKIRVTYGDEENKRIMNNYSLKQLSKVYELRMHGTDFPDYEKVEPNEYQMYLNTNLGKVPYILDIPGSSSFTGSYKSVLGRYDIYWKNTDDASKTKNIVNGGVYNLDELKNGYLVPCYLYPSNTNSENFDTVVDMDLLNNISNYFTDEGEYAPFVSNDIVGENATAWKWEYRIEGDEVEPTSNPKYKFSLNDFENKSYIINCNFQLSTITFKSNPNDIKISFTGETSESGGTGTGGVILNSSPTGSFPILSEESGSAVITVYPEESGLPNKFECTSTIPFYLYNSNTIYYYILDFDSYRNNNYEGKVMNTKNVSDLDLDTSTLSSSVVASLSNKYGALNYDWNSVKYKGKYTLDIKSNFDSAFANPGDYYIVFGNVVSKDDTSDFQKTAAYKLTVEKQVLDRDFVLVDTSKSYPFGDNYLSSVVFKVQYSEDGVTKTCDNRFTLKALCEDSDYSVYVDASLIKADYTDPANNYVYDSYIGNVPYKITDKNNVTVFENIIPVVFDTTKFQIADSSGSTEINNITIEDFKEESYRLIYNGYDLPDDSVYVYSMTGNTKTETNFKDDSNFTWTFEGYEEDGDLITEYPITNDLLNKADFSLETFGNLEPLSALLGRFDLSVSFNISGIDCAGCNASANISIGSGSGSGGSLSIKQSFESASGFEPGEKDTSNMQAISTALSGETDKANEVVYCLKGDWVAPDEAITISGNVRLLSNEGATIYRSKSNTAYSNPVFVVSEGATLTLGGGTSELILDGNENNTGYNNSFIKVEGGTLVMENNSVIQNSHNSTKDDTKGLGAIDIKYSNSSAPKFVMEGGEIRNCTASQTGGAAITSTGKSGILAIIDLKGGKIIENTGVGNGGAIILTYSTLTLDGTEISGNYMKSSSNGDAGGTISSGGGAIYMKSTTSSMTLKSGSISENKTNGFGGALLITAGELIIPSDSTVTINDNKVVNVSGDTETEVTNRGAFIGFCNNNNCKVTIGDASKEFKNTSFESLALLTTSVTSN